MPRNHRPKSLHLKENSILCVQAISRILCKGVSTAMFKKITEVKPQTKKYYLGTPPQYPVLKPNTLLQKKHLSQILSRLPVLANAPKEHYQHLYRQVVINFAEWVQGIPATKAPYFEYHGGMLDLGIARAYESLRFYRKQYPLPKNVTPEQMPPKIALWSYAIFTAGLLYGIGYLGAGFTISTCDNHGHDCQRWHPYNKSMSHHNNHYRYAAVSENRDSLASRVAPIIAERIMPKEGLAWIATDQEVLEYWLSILQNDERGSGIFAKIVMYINDQLITDPLEFTSLMDLVFPESAEELLADAEKEEKQEKEKTEDKKESIFNHREEKRLHIPGQSVGIPLSELDIVGINTSELGELFIYWLRNGVKGVGISVNRNDSGVHVLEGGKVFVSSELIQAFIKSNPGLGAQSIQQVQQSLERTGLALESASRTQQFSNDSLSQRQSMLQKGTLSQAKGSVFLAENIFNGATMPSITSTYHTHDFSVTSSLILSKI